MKFEDMIEVGPFWFLEQYSANSNRKHSVVPKEAIFQTSLVKLPGNFNKLTFFIGSIISNL